MEDILITDIQEFEEITDSEVIDKQVPVSVDDVNRKEIVEGGELQDKSDVSILGSNDINDIRSVKTIDINKYTNYDNTLLWSNPSPSSSWSTNVVTITLNDDISNYDLICFVYTWSGNEYEVLSDPEEILTRESTTKGYPSFSIANASVNYGGRYFAKGTNDNQIIVSGANSSDMKPLYIYGLKYKELSNNDTPTPSPNPSVSGNVINNYYITVSGNGVSYNLIDKPLNEYTPTESMLALSILFALGIGFVILMRKVVFRWK